MEKIKQYRYIIVGLIVIIIIGFVFYWIAIRPVQVRKECSLFTDIIPADVGVTKEQAEKNKIVFDNTCDKSENYNGTFYLGLSTSPGVWGRLQCRDLYKDSVERVPQPMREGKRDATKTEYEMCLRQNGLEK